MPLPEQDDGRDTGWGPGMPNPITPYVPAIRETRGKIEKDRLRERVLQSYIIEKAQSASNGQRNNPD